MSERERGGEAEREVGRETDRYCISVNINNSNNESNVINVFFSFANILDILKLSVCLNKNTLNGI